MNYQTTKERPLEQQKIDVLNTILDIKLPPVARCRLLSNGIEPYHRLYLPHDAIIIGDKACIACGNCVDSCPVLRREPQRRQKTTQRTSMSLEITVAEDCEQCYACVLSCPQVDTALKDYVVEERVVEVIPQSRTLKALDNYFMMFIALVIGIIIGVFMTW
ncbi:4Fe-4S dicluster domain-containing protein [candidate division KSB1 bacterium]|nr:4Fe-4S dicluster domain-containing protein [candidate division KSB1 bacterium]